MFSRLHSPISFLFRSYHSCIAPCFTLFHPSHICPIMLSLIRMRLRVSAYHCPVHSVMRHCFIHIPCQCPSPASHSPIMVVAPIYSSLSIHSSMNHLLHCPSIHPCTCRVSIRILQSIKDVPSSGTAEWRKREDS